MTTGDAGARLIRAAPALFVLLWSTGFIGAKLGLPYAEPMTFLLLRFAVVVALLLPAALWLKSRWPRSARQAGHVAVAGMLLHGGYLGGVFGAIHHGVPAGITALIVALQPLLTASLAGPLLGERVSALQWSGLALGIGGVAMVVLDKGTWVPQGHLGTALAFLALVSITAGTLYQKRWGGGVSLLSGNVIQFSAAALLLMPFALLFETREVQWTASFAFALGWLVVVLSLGAISLLYLMLRRGEAARVASLFYLTPAVTAIMAYLLFGERLGPLALGGMAATVAGVALVLRR